MWVAAAAYLLLINVVTYRTFAEDKRRAQTRERRVPERVLLWLAALGGTPGAVAAQRRFRHKTRKQPFGLWLWGIFGVQMAVALAIAFAI